VKDTCIEFMIPDDEGILLLFKSQVATLHPEILDCLCLTRKELRVMFMIASKLAAIKTACPMRSIAVVSATTSGGWRSPATPTQSKSMSFLWMRPPRRARGGVSE
jgi:hypothetical protein